MNAPDTFAVTYSLGRHVPSMRQHGLRIETVYGEIEIEPGPLANAIAALVEADLRRQLAAIEAEAQQ
jgi:hypothetical protein